MIEANTVVQIAEILDIFRIGLRLADYEIIAGDTSSVCVWRKEATIEQIFRVPDTFGMRASLHAHESQEEPAVDAFLQARVHFKRWVDYEILFAQCSVQRILGLCHAREVLSSRTAATA